MDFFSGRNVIKIFTNALNYIDKRLVNHGERVSYIVYKMLKEEGKYSDEELLYFCYLATVHDIGAYKTEEVTAIINSHLPRDFELMGTLSHSVYGYLFIDKFSTLSQYADAILFHHFPYDVLDEVGCINKDLAAKLFIADRIDILFSTQGTFVIDENTFNGLHNTSFKSSDIELIKTLEKKYSIIETLSSGNYLSEICEFYRSVKIPSVVYSAFLRTLIYSIDFKSVFTVMHTITTVCFSVEIAKQMGIQGKYLQKVYLGSLLHDIGKISTPLHILEKEGKLTSEEYDIMKQHVVASENILKGYIEDDILKIGVRHHEKLDGSGYPRGLVANDLTLSERIVCVADILSALSGKRSYKEAMDFEEISTILNNMSITNKIDSDVVKTVLENFDVIFENVKKDSAKTLKTYTGINEHYALIIEEYKDYL